MDVVSAADRHYQSAAAELAEAEGHNGMKGGMRIAIAMVHALLYVGKQIEELRPRLEAIARAR